MSLGECLGECLGDGLYDAFMYPLEALGLRRTRRGLIRRASGRVLEVGAGTGANLPFYRWERIRELHLLDIDPGEALGSIGAVAGVPVTAHTADVQALPFPDRAFDTVVSTLLFCSVADPVLGLSEVRRLLASGGRLLFMEHVRPRRLPGLMVDAVAPAWCALTGQCHLDRDTLAAIRRSGLSVESVVSSAGGLLIHGVAARTD